MEDYAVTPHGSSYIVVYSSSCDIHLFIVTDRSIFGYGSSEIKIKLIELDLVFQS